MSNKTTVLKRLQAQIRRLEEELDLLSIHGKLNCSKQQQLDELLAQHDVLWWDIHHTSKKVQEICRDARIDYQIYL